MGVRIRPEIVMGEIWIEENVPYYSYAGDFLEMRSSKGSGIEVRLESVGFCLRFSNFESKGGLVAFAAKENCGWNVNKVEA